MKSSRRNFLIGSLGFTLGGCSTIRPKSSESFGNSDFTSSARSPNSKKSLGYRLSSPTENLRNHYPTVIVGSGYGASVMAARLSASGQKVCVLERGPEWHPGDFPETPYELNSTFRSPLTPLGLIDIAPGQDLDIVCGNGLGGTSLINAAIAIRPEMSVFEQTVWPEALRDDARSGQLELYYKKAESILQPVSLNQIRFPKSQNHRRDTLAHHRQWGELNLNIRNEEFGRDKLNSFGYPQSSCIQCGNCCSGCNYGAKNTLLTNYLFLAYKAGTEIYTQVEVIKLEKKGPIYILDLKLYNDLGIATRRKISADRVFLGAGSKGSTEILMRSESNEFQLSPALGTRLSANGDVMGLSYNTDFKTNSIGSTRFDLQNGAGNNGLIISSFADYRNPSLNNDVMSQFLLLDGVVPSALAPAVAKALASYALLRQEKIYGKASTARKKQKMDRILLDQMALTTSPDGALNHSMLYFACGHDSSGGRFVFDKESDSFDYVWKNVVKEPTFKRIEKVMRSFAAKNGGHFMLNPRSKAGFGDKIQATHPLGGCPMSDDPKSGVTDHLGRVFNARGGFHEGLHVVDAALIPHSLSATPLLTITALAERIAEKLLK